MTRRNFLYALMLTAVGWSARFALFKRPICRIEDRYFTSIKDAMDYAKPGQTIQVLPDQYIEEPIVMKEWVKLDGGNSLFKGPITVCATHEVNLDARDI